MKKTNFTKSQKFEIEEGIRLGLDVGIYAKPEFMAIQMYEIRLGLMDGLPVEKYARTEYDWFQMEEIRKGLKSGLEIEKYANPAIPFEVMRQIRKGLKIGIDISQGAGFPAEILRQLRKAAKAGVNLAEYIRAGYDGEQLREIRVAMQNGVQLEPYLSKDYRNVSLREIRLGLERNIEVSRYARPEFTWRQMREIRLGLEERLEIETYDNPLYSWQQMREIRLGLEEQLDVSGYANLMYTAREMKKKRLQLLESGRFVPLEEAGMAEKTDALYVLISENEMEAMVLLQQEASACTKEDVLTALKENGVVCGIDDNAVDELLSGQCDSAVVARGTAPSKGKDGWYEYFFRTDIKKKPKLLEDGSVDYLNMDWFEVVYKNDKIAYYHEAEIGDSGITVTGRKVPGVKGKEKKMLSGKGFLLMSDRKTYVADMDGKVELDGDCLEISNLLVLEEAAVSTGNINFNGSIYIKGVVAAGIHVYADKDILIDGFVEGAEIEAGGDIFIRKGNNSSGRGFIKAGRDVNGNFFEMANIYAGGNIRANYCLNCEMYAEGKIEIYGRNGMLAGGSAYAAEEIQSQYIGNDAGIMTYIRLGKNDDLFNREKELLEKEKSIEQEILLLKNAYFSFQRKYSVEERNINPMYLKLENAIYTKEMEMGEVLAEKEKIQKKKNKYMAAKLIVRGTLFEGVSLNINGSIWNTQKMNDVILKKKGDRIIVWRER